MPRKDRAFGVWFSPGSKAGGGRRKMKIKTVGRKIRSSYRAKQSRSS
jgi:hypothetical protein